MSDRTSIKTAKLHALQESFRSQLPDRLAVIQRAWTEVVTHPAEETPRKELYRLIHSLAGAAGTFGYHQLGERAHQLERLLVRHSQDSKFSADSTESIARSLAQLETLAAGEPDRSRDQAPATADWLAGVSAQDKVLVYVLVDDPLQAQEIVSQLQHFGYAAESFPAAADIVEAQTQRPADALILDIELPVSSLEGPRIAPLLQLLGKQNVSPIFISARVDWQARLAALRAGGGAYFAKPVDMTALMEQLDRQTSRKILVPFRVMIVEDTVLLAEHYAAVLQAAGMETEIVINPERLLDALSAFGPDIIIMDLHMPQCSGIEAAQVIRQYPAYRSLPIVYLSTESALQQQLNALRLGGDDFLQKPIGDAHLVSAVGIRAERFRGLNALMTCDSLTGLLNHISLKMALGRELALAQRRRGSLAFAMLDIDHFKSVNDRYGHPVGDRVIKSLARLLTQRLRKSDITGRYGGEEFVVILPDTDPETARVVLDDLRARFAEITYVHEAGEFNATFSAGISTAPPHTDMDSMIGAADAALYEAKHAGRNRICLVPAGAT